MATGSAKSADGGSLKAMWPFSPKPTNAQSIGAALYEEMVIDASGRVVNPRFRDYHFPSFGDVPRTEVLFADTSDALGPMGAKSMSESPYNPVAAALGNALRDATGIRFTAVPFKPDRLFPLLKAGPDSIVEFAISPSQLPR